MKNETKKNKTNIIIAVIVLLATLLSLGYGFFAQKLAYRLPLINNQGDANGDIWNVSFTDASLVSITNNAKELSPVTFNNSTASFNIMFVQLGDNVTYDFTITNKGKLDAKVDSILIIPSSTTDDYVDYEIGGLTAGDELDVGESTHVIVSATYSKEQEAGNIYSKSITVIINYVQK